jgi:TRAP transporter TAXI family solute receptor
MSSADSPEEPSGAGASLAGSRPDRDSDELGLPPAAGEEGGASSDFWKIWGLVIVLVVVGLVIAWQQVGDAPPRRIVVATGVEGGGYDRAGLFLQQELREAGIEVELRRTQGSIDNLAALHEGEVDLAFVQGGLGAARSAAADGEHEVVGVASLYYEPLWIFVRRTLSELVDLRGLRGRRIEIGAEGSGTHAVALSLLTANDVDASNTTLLESSVDDGVEALVAGDCEAMMLVASPGSPRVARLLREPSVRAFDLRRVNAYVRQFLYLTPLRMTRGMHDLAEDLPVEPVRLVAPTAMVLASADLHPAILPLVIEAMRARFGRGGLFEDEDEFPSPRKVDVPVAAAAERYYRDGPSFLFRVLPFQVAATLDRLKVMLLPLLTLLLPLVRVAPPAYRWRIRSKITRWYRVVIELEARVRQRPTERAYDQAVRELEKVQQEIAEVRVPLGYAEELYNLRMHLGLVRREFVEKRRAAR